MATASTTQNGPTSRSEESQEAQTNVNATTEYCAKLQEWMWQYYWGYANWQNWMTLTTFPFPPCNFPVAGNYQAPTGTPWPAGQPTLDARYGYNYPGIGYPFPFPAPPTTGFQTGQQMTAGTLPHDARPVQQQNGNAPQAGTLQFYDDNRSIGLHSLTDARRSRLLFVSSCCNELVQSNTSRPTRVKQTKTPFLYLFITRISCLYRITCAAS